MVHPPCCHQQSSPAVLAAQEYTAALPVNFPHSGTRRAVAKAPASAIIVARSADHGGISVGRKCDGRALLTASSCRGPEGCNFDGQESQERKVQCDDRIAMDGDACESVDRITCGAGNGFELVCDGHRYRKKRECRRGGCRIQDDELFCD